MCGEVARLLEPAAKRPSGQEGVHTGAGACASGRRGASGCARPAATYGRPPHALLQYS